ncbi:MAG: proline--tRNA ligase [bacterium]
MRLSKAFVPTLKEIPTDATIPSHQLMLRAGLMRQLTAGVYMFLPLGYKAMLKVMQIVREEMNAIGGQEFLFPALNPEALWIQTGRRTIQNFILSVKERDLVLAPTHEEVVGWLAAGHIQSYKDLPQIWYQIQNKFRNEPRPRSGVLRGRQFIMKDSYTLDATWEGLDAGYDAHAQAYRNIFQRCGLKYFEVVASSGAMGGTGSQEFMIDSDHGEDTVVLCKRCGYAANLEIATSSIAKLARESASDPLKELHTPNVKTINDLAEFLKVPHTQLAKSVVYKHDGKPLLVLMSGNDQLNESKLLSALKGGEIGPMDPDALKGLTGADAGSIGPVGLKGFRIIADRRLEGANNLISGANRNDYHIGNIDMDRDMKVEGFFDLRTVEEGEPCPKCSATMKISNAIELGHIFKLGTKYSDALHATFLDENGQSNPIIMGSYGIGIERIIACHIEQNRDDNGIIWDKAIAPYLVHIIAVNMNSKEIIAASNQLYYELTRAGIEPLFDDRSNVTPGFKFKDADLLGMPLQIIVGEKGLKNGQMEIKKRRTGERMMVAREEIINAIKKLLNE